MPTVGGCTNLPESESRFRRSASVAVPPPFTEVACYQVVTLAAGGELSLPEAGAVGLGEAFYAMPGAVISISREGVKNSFFAVEKRRSLCYNSKSGYCLHLRHHLVGFPSRRRFVRPLNFTVSLYKTALVKAVIEG